MATKVSPKSLLPKSVTDNSKVNEVTDLEQIKELLKDRTIVASDRFILEPGSYKFEGVEAAEWNIGNGRNAKKAVMAVITFKGGKMTTLGSLRKVDANMKTYGPDHMPFNEAEVLEKIISEGITVTAIEDTKVTVFQNGDRVVDEKDSTGYKTKPAKIMAWKFGSK